MREPRCGGSSCEDVVKVDVAKDLPEICEVIVRKQCEFESRIMHRES